MPGGDVALSGVRTPSSGLPSLRRGEGSEGQGGGLPGMLLRSRASAGAALEGIRKGRARRGMLPLGVSFWDGAFLALQPGGRGACLSFRPGGRSNLVEEVRKGCSALSHGRGRCIPPFLLPLGRVPPWCSTDPASPTAALQKGLCWGVCRLYPGLRGCVRRRKRRREGLNPAACY